MMTSSPHTQLQKFLTETVSVCKKEIAVDLKFISVIPKHEGSKSA